MGVIGLITCENRRADPSFRWVEIKRRVRAFAEDNRPAPAAIGCFGNAVVDVLNMVSKFESPETGVGDQGIVTCGSHGAKFAGLLAERRCSVLPGHAAVVRDVKLAGICVVKKVGLHYDSHPR